MEHHETILIIDFGSQYTQLITRRVRENSVYSEIHPHIISLEEVKKINPAGIILSGGPMSVYDKDAPEIDEGIIKLGVPVLGICYGLQMICKTFNGKVEPADDREYGRAELNINKTEGLFKDVKPDLKVWMSHGDFVSGAPEGFSVIASSKHSPVAAIENKEKRIYGVQFHPEVEHTEMGREILKNYLFEICNCKGNWTPANFVNESIEEIKKLPVTQK